MKSTPLPNTLPCDVDTFPHYRTRSEVLLFPNTRCRPPSPEIRDVYRYGWINNKFQINDISMIFPCSHPFDAVSVLFETPSPRLEIPVLGEPTTHGEPFGSIEIGVFLSPIFISAARRSRTIGLPNHFPYEGVGAPYNPGPMCSVLSDHFTTHFA